MLNQTVTADRSYPIAIVHGYRGLNVSNYVPGDGTTMGMSKYTMLGFLGQRCRLVRVERRYMDR